MEYLIINGSPRKGNTWKVVEAVRDRIAAASPDARFHELHLSKLELPYCTGCSTCFRQGGGHCPHRGVMDDVIAMMEQADGLIFAVTTFNMAPNALAKNFLDHLCYMLHRPRFFTKKALVVTSTGGVGAGKAVKYVAGTLLTIGYNRCFALPVTALSWNAYQPQGKALAKPQRVADRFHADVASGRLHAPTLSMLMVYNLFRGMGRSSAPGCEYPTEDGTHWTDEKRAHRAYDASVPLRNPVKRLFGAAFYGFGRVGGRFLTVTYKKE